MSDFIGDRPQFIEGLFEGFRRRWQRDEPTRVEDYMEELRQLLEDEYFVLDLLLAEKHSREGKGEVLELEEYRGRFPQWHEQLTALWETDQLFIRGPEGEQSDPEAPGVAAGSNNTPAVDGGLKTKRPCTAEPNGLPRVAGYDVLKFLGRGSTGEVYQARHLKLNRVVALKILRDGEPGTLERRLRYKFEAETVARIQDLNVVQIHEVGEHAGRPYLALKQAKAGVQAGPKGRRSPVRTAPAAAPSERNVGARL